MGGMSYFIQQKKIFKEMYMSDLANNPEINELKEINDSITNLENDKKEKINEIRSKFEKAVIVFIDMVDSTSFKVAHSGSPQNWILRLWEFCSIISFHVKACHGEVVKYIGDEVMAVFKGENALEFSSTFLSMCDKMQEKIKDKCGFESLIKISIDYGDVFYIGYEGHSSPDPQGTPVDRCARIAKYLKPEKILASSDYVKNLKTGSTLFKKIGKAPAKGLENVTIYQYAENTIQLVEKSDISKEEESELREKIEDLSIENSQLTQQNEELQKLLDGANATVPDELKAKKEESGEMQTFEELVNDVNKALSGLSRGTLSSTVKEYILSDHCGKHPLYPDGYDEQFEELGKNNIYDPSDGELLWESSFELKKLSSAIEKLSKLIEGGSGVEFAEEFEKQYGEEMPLDITHARFWDAFF